MKRGLGTGIKVFHLGVAGLKVGPLRCGKRECLEFIATWENDLSSYLPVQPR